MRKGYLREGRNGEGTERGKEGGSEEGGNHSGGGEQWSERGSKEGRDLICDGNDYYGQGVYAMELSCVIWNPSDAG